MRVLTIVVVCLLVLAACSKHDDKAVPPARSDDLTANPTELAQSTPDASGSAARRAERDPQMDALNIAVMTEVADIVADAGKDCRKLAADINKYVTSNQDRLRTLKAWEQTPEQKQENHAIFKPHIDAAITKMMPTMEACGGNKAVEAAMRELDF